MVLRSRIHRLLPADFPRAARRSATSCCLLSGMIAISKAATAQAARSGLPPPCHWTAKGRSPAACNSRTGKRIHSGLFEQSRGEIARQTSSDSRAWPAERARTGGATVSQGAGNGNVAAGRGRVPGRELGSGRKVARAGCTRRVTATTAEFASRENSWLRKEKVPGPQAGGAVVSRWCQLEKPIRIGQTPAGQRWILDVTFGEDSRRQQDRDVCALVTATIQCRFAGQPCPSLLFGM